MVVLQTALITQETAMNLGTDNDSTSKIGSKFTSSRGFPHR